MSRVMSTVAGLVLLGVVAPSCGSGDVAQAPTARPAATSRPLAESAPRAAPTEQAAPPVGVHVEAARYRFAFADDAAMRRGGRLRVLDAAGHAVSIRRAYVVTHSISLAPCRPRIPTVPGGPAAPEGRTGGHGVPPRHWLAGWFGVPSARAGHGSPDPSATPTPRVESLLAPSETAVSRRFPADHYCRVHHVLGRADDRAEGVTPEVPMARITLDLLAEVETGRGPSRALALRTAVAHGRLDELPASLAGGCVDGRARHLDVTLTRHLGGLFAGLDAATLGEADLARGVLVALVGDATIEVHDTEP